MNKQDLRVSANNLESIVLQSEHFLSHTVFLVAFGVAALSGAWREVAESSSLPSRASFDRTKFPSPEVSSEVAACPPLWLFAFCFCFSIVSLGLIRSSDVHGFD